jgi:hypothetical protein
MFRGLSKQDTLAHKVTVDAAEIRVAAAGARERQAHRGSCAHSLDGRMRAIPCRRAETAAHAAAHLLNVAALLSALVKGLMSPIWFQYPLTGPTSGISTRADRNQNTAAPTANAADAISNRPLIVGMRVLTVIMRASPGRGRRTKPSCVRSTKLLQGGRKKK